MEENRYLIDARKLIELISSETILTPQVLNFKWYTKKGYGDWRFAMGRNKERGRIISIIEEMTKNGK